MKKLITLAIGMMVVASAVATQKIEPNRLLQKQLVPKRTVEFAAFDRDARVAEITQKRASERQQRALRERTETANPVSFSGMLEQHKPSVFRQAVPISDFEGKHRLDSAISRDFSGNYFERVVYHYNELQFPVKQVDYFFENGRWNVFRQVEITWNEAGFVATFSEMLPLQNVGGRQVFHYNALNQVELTIYYSVNPTTGLAVRTGKRYEERDQAGNVTREFVQNYIDGVLENTALAYQTFAKVSEGYYERTSYRFYFWDNGWVGAQRGENIRGENWYRFTQYFWDNGWVYDGRVRWEFLPGYWMEPKVTRQEIFTWNTETDSWDALSLSILDYDSEGRKLHELFSNYVNGEWIPSIEVIVEWTHPMFWVGYRDAVETWYRYDDEGITKEKIVEFIRRYQVGMFGDTFIYEKTFILDDYDVWRPWSEKEYEFDHPDTGDVITFREWFFNDDKVRLAHYKEIITRNLYGELKKSEHFFGGGISDDDWALSMTWLYDYENGMEVRRRSFRGVEMTPNFGRGFSFDFDVPRSELIVFSDQSYDGLTPGGHLQPTPYKLLTIHGYEGNGATFDISVGTFFWSEVRQTSIQPPSTENSVFVFPNPVTDSFTIGGLTESTLVSITDIHGRVVLQQTISPNETVSVNHLSAGVYFVRANGNVMRIVRK